MLDNMQINKTVFNLLIILLFGITAFFGYKYFKLKKQIDKSSSVISKKKALPTPTIVFETRIPTQISGSSSEPNNVLKKIKTLPTTDWKIVSNSGVSFKIPSEASCNSKKECTNVS